MGRSGILGVLVALACSSGRDGGVTRSVTHSDYPGDDSGGPNLSLDGAGSSARGGATAGGSSGASGAPATAPDASTTDGFSGAGTDASRASWSYEAPLPPELTRDATPEPTAVVACAGGDCSPGEVCCLGEAWTTLLSGSFAVTEVLGCDAQPTCDAYDDVVATLECDGPEDCAAGLSCCTYVESFDVPLIHNSRVNLWRWGPARCAETCSMVTACHSDTDCPDSTCYGARLCDPRDGTDAGTDAAVRADAGE